MPGKGHLDRTEPSPFRTSTDIDTCMRPVQEYACHFIVDGKGHIKFHTFLRDYWQLMFVGEWCHFIGCIATEKMFVLQSWINSHNYVSNLHQIQ